MKGVAGRVGVGRGNIGVDGEGVGVGESGVIGGSEIEAMNPRRKWNDIAKQRRGKEVQ